MESIPAISVIMSVKNGARTLDKCMKSLLNQTFSDFEIIVCDDGSTDDTLAKLSFYMNLDPRVRVLQNIQSKGLAYSLNRCIEESKSNILARQDADDWSDLKRFEIQYKFVSAHPEYAIVGTQWYNVNGEGNMKKSDVKTCPIARDQIKGGLFMHPSWMMRKDLLEKVDFYTVNKYTKRSQDYHLVMKLLGAGMKMYNMPEHLYYYSADESTIARSIDWKKVKGLMWIRWDAYRRNKLPLWSYLYVLKPLISNIIPRKFMERHYRSVYGK